MAKNIVNAFQNYDPSSNTFGVIFNTTSVN